LATNINPIKIDCADLQAHREKITNILNKYKDMTAKNLYQLGKAEGIKHKIQTTGQIVYQRPRRQARALQKFVQKEVKEMLASGVIGPSTVPFKKMCLANLHEKLVILSVRCLSKPYIKFPASLSVYVK
jgi:hypothetical protein